MELLFTANLALVCLVCIVVESAYQSGFLQPGRQFGVSDCSTQLIICLNFYLLCFMANTKERDISYRKTRHENLPSLRRNPVMAPRLCAAPCPKSQSNRN